MNEAEQVEPLNELDQKIEDALKETSEESAPPPEEVPEVEKPKETAEETDGKPLSERANKRIKKVTADKWEATRRAEEAERKLAEMQAKQPASQPKPEPKLEDFDYDESAHQSALIDWKVDQKVDQKADSMQKQQQDLQTEQSKAEATKKFAGNCAVFAEDKADFNAVLNSVPTLQPSVLDELMAMDNGPELAYFLGNNQEIANNIVRMNPVAAGIKIGEIARKLAEPTQIKPSSAPDPIEPVSSGGVVENDIGDEMSIDAWMAKHNP